jgi:hypothetical protein
MRLSVNGQDRSDEADTFYGMEKNEVETDNKIDYQFQ